MRCLTWGQLETLPAGSLDLAFAIDSSSEIAAGSDDGITIITRLLRPDAPLIAGELAPSAFWDIVRGSRRRWWARSANAEFPVGALLTDQEWIDEFETAGFTGISVSPAFGEARVGVVVHGLAGSIDRNVISAAEPAVFSWQGTAAADLKALIGHRGSEASRPEHGASTDHVISISPDGSSADPVEALTDHLDAIAEQCRTLADTSGRLWIVVDFGPVDALVPLEQPLWCALIAATRVARNEYPGLHIRCIGLAGTTSSWCDQASCRGDARSWRGTRAVLSGRQPHRLPRRTGNRRSPAAPARCEQYGPAPCDASGLRARRARLDSGTRRAPEAGEVEIEVATTGLNFRDVMWNLRLLPEEALEDGYAGPGLGMECAGTMSARGPMSKA